VPYRSINPFTQEVLAEYPEQDEREIEAVLASAQQAFSTDWGVRSFDDRAKLLNGVADLLSARQRELAALMTTEMGKLIGEAEWEVSFCADVFRWYAQNASSLLADRPVGVAAGSARVVARPLGVVFCIEPWNFPLFQLARVTAPILMAGNSVVMKHAGSVPQCALAFEKVLADAGVPQGVYSNVFVSNEMAATIVRDARVRAISLTGSERAGSAVGAEAGKALKKASMELGGSDAFIVLEDADLDLAVPLAVAGRMMNSGQACGGSKRFIIHERLHDAFVERFAEALEALMPGDPGDPATSIGPLVSKQALDGVLDQIDAAVSSGARIVTGGRRLDRTGWFLAPTILVDVDRSNPVFHQELFAPVAMVFSAASEEEALEIANDSPYGLGGSIITQDLDKAQRLAARLETGMVFINQIADSAANMPWGGVKNSGYGRELSEFGISDFVNWQLIRIAAKGDGR
jgi:succinate-semialdehyde dehydrogenase / glutarate-semialdehyde dehydrogenase